MLTKCWANTGKCQANCGQMQDIRQANAGQMSDKCWASAGQMKAKCQANAGHFFQNWAIWLFVYHKYENRTITLKKQFLAFIVVKMTVILNHCSENLLNPCRN